MELSTVQAEMDALRPEKNDTRPMYVMMAKLGQIAQSEGKMASVDNLSENEQERADRHRRDLFAALVMTTLQYADQHDIDVDHALEERLEFMQKQQDRREKIADADDAEELAEAMEQSDDDNTEDTRGFY